MGHPTEADGLHVCCALQCLPKRSGAKPQQPKIATPPATKEPTGTTTGVEENPEQLQKDLTCNCPRAVTAAKAVAAALAQSGNSCGSNSGQALARKCALLSGLANAESVTVKSSSYEAFKLCITGEAWHGMAWHSECTSRHCVRLPQQQHSISMPLAQHVASRIALTLC